MESRVSVPESRWLLQERVFSNLTMLRRHISEKSLKGRDSTNLHGLGLTTSDGSMAKSFEALLDTSKLARVILAFA